MNIYVAGSSLELDRVAAFIARIREAGHTITYDWPHALITSGLSANDGLTPAQSRKAARDCAVGVTEADVFVLLAPATPTIGAWVELGIAWRLSYPPLIVGAYPPTIFASICDHVATEIEAIEWLAGWKR